ncbi:hypothetical protein D3C71_2068780 [compost metagenome]
MRMGLAVLQCQPQPTLRLHLTGQLDGLLPHGFCLQQPAGLEAALERGLRKLGNPAIGQQLLHDAALCSEG